MQTAVISLEEVDNTITAFTRLDQRGDTKAMNKLATRLQREQPFLLQYAARSRESHGNTVGEAAVFYATLVWSMFDRHVPDTLPRLTAENFAAAEEAVSQALSKITDLQSKPSYERMSADLAARQPHIYSKIRELFEEDVREVAMTEETCAIIVQPTQVVIEAFDAAITGRNPGERQGPVVNTAPSIGRNDPCRCGSGKKFKKCCGA